MTGGGSTRLLFVINGLGTGGAERSLAEMLPRFTARGYECSVAVLHQREEGVESAVRESGVPVNWLGPGRWIPWYTSLRKMIGEWRPDLIHTTIFEADIVGRSVAWRYRIPAVSSVVNTSYGSSVRSRDSRVPGWKLGLARALDGFTARACTSHLHAISEATKSEAISALGYPEDRIKVVYRGRDPVRLGEKTSSRRATARQRLGVAEESILLLNVGRQEFQKGQRYLLQSLKTLREDSDTYQLVVAGRTGHATEELESMVLELGLGDSVHFAGHSNEIGELLAAADVFVFPSLYEGLGTSVLEAMAMGLPIVASDLPAIREMVIDGESALLVPPSSPGEFASAVERISGDRTVAHRLGEAAKRTFDERFQIDTCARGMMDLYEAVLGRNHPGGPV